MTKRATVNFKFESKEKLEALRKYAGDHSLCETLTRMIDEEHARVFPVDLNESEDKAERDKIHLVPDSEIKEVEEYGEPSTES